MRFCPGMASGAARWGRRWARGVVRRRYLWIGGSLCFCFVWDGEIPDGVQHVEKAELSGQCVANSVSGLGIAIGRNGPSPSSPERTSAGV